MSFSQIFALLVISSFFTFEANAQECNKLVGVDPVIECLLAKHPQLGIAKLEVDIASSETDRASQRINPQLEWQGTETQGGRGLTHEFNLMHTIELGSKQGARVELAEASIGVKKAGFEKEYNKLRAELIMDFYRYRQILHEMEIVEENKNTFVEMISQFKRIGRLNPEQEVSLNVFTLSMEEIRLKLHHLENEKDEILANLELVLQSRFIPNKNQLPPVDHKWPELKSGSFQGALLKEVNARTVEAQKNYELEKAESWPNLAIGPRVQTVPGPQGGTFFGAAVSLPLPFLSLNGGGRAKAMAQKKKRELEARLTQRRLEIESRRLVATYNRSISSHRKAIKSSTILKKHKKLHRMISRGVVSPAMVIELHREIIEFYESLHEHELDAVKTRWRYYSLHGKLDQKSIQETRGM